MKNIFAVAVSSVVLLAVPASAGADTSSGTLTVTGAVEGSFNLTVQSAGGTTSGIATDDAHSALGSVAKHGNAPTGFTLTRGTTNWMLSSMVGVKVVQANSTSTDYTLQAQLGAVPVSGVTWRLNGSTLSDAAPTTVTSNGSYGSTILFAWDILVTDEAADQALSNSIVLTATSN